MRIYFLLICIMFLNNKTFAQELGKQILSPNSYEISRMNANEIDNFTGVPSINIPLQSIDVDGYKVNVNLSYNAEGIKVGQQSSNVGLGWNLSHGGSIIRKVRGMYDERIATDITQGGFDNQIKKGWLQGNGIQNVNLYNWASSSRELQDYKNALSPFFILHHDKGGRPYHSIEQFIDTEPDIFEFNFNGKSGKFIFDNNNGEITIHQIPWMGLKIEYNMGTDPDLPTSPSIESFKITDTDNTQYFFNTSEYYINAESFTGIRLSNVWQPHGDRHWQKYRSSWYLTKVITPNKHVVNYSYNDEQILTKGMGMQAFSKHLLYNFSPVGSDSIVNIVSQQETLVNGKRISKIEGTDFKIEFFTNIARNYNNRGHFIDGIRVYNSKNKLVKRIGLFYDEYESDGIQSVTSTSDKAQYSRTILKEIKTFNAEFDDYDSYKFEYNLKGFGGDDSKVLPHNNSFATDIWGYYNGMNTNRFFVPKVYVYPDISFNDRRFRLERLTNYLGREFIFDGADRRPNASYMDIGVLKRIQYPTGGYTTFEFEPNQYLDENEIFIGPGLRIKKMILNDGYKDQIKLYNYNDISGKTTGRIIAKPKMTDIVSDYYPNENSINYYAENLTRYSDSQTDIKTIDNRLIGYSEVSIIEPNNGKSVFKYSNYGNLNEIDDINMDEDDTGSCSFMYPFGYCDGLFYNSKIFHIDYAGFKNNPNNFNNYPPISGSTPFPPAPNYDWNRGILLSSELYNSNNKLVKKTNYVYKNYTPLPTSNRKPYTIFGLKVNQLFYQRQIQTSDFIDGSTIRASKYRILTDIIKLPSETIETNYSPDNSSSQMTTKTLFEYSNPNHPFLTKESFINSKNQEITTKYYYPPDLFTISDVNQRSLMYEMTSNNQINTPVVVQKTNDNTVISENRTVYGYTKDLNNENLIVPKALLSKKGSETQENADRIISYDSYDKYGNLTQYTTENGIPVSLVWGYKNKYIVLKLEGLKLEDLVLTNQMLMLINEGTCPPNLFHSLRTYYPNAQITSYEHEPLVGVKSITDANGVTVNYTYDDFGRLSNIQDQDGNIISEFKYNLKN